MNINEQELNKIIKNILKEYIDLSGVTDKNNVVKNTFLGDTLQLRNIIQKVLPNQNLKYLGAGAFGIAFNVSGGLKIPSNFMSNGFIGELPPQGSDVVIKVTTNIGEYKKIKDIIQNHKGIIPSSAKYYFIKEVDLPSDKQFSSTIGPPSNDDKDMVKSDRIKKFKEMDWWKAPDNYSPAKIEKEKEKIVKNLIKRKIKKDEVKLEKLYIICLEKIRSLTPEEKDAVRLAFEYTWWLQWRDKPSTKNEIRGIKPIGVIKSVYMNDDKIKKFYYETLRKKSKPNSMDYEYKHYPEITYFKETLNKLVNSLGELWSGPYKPFDFDTHDGNIGVKGNGDFVFFDMFA